MSAALHLANSDDMDRLLPLVDACRQEGMTPPAAKSAADGGAVAVAGNAAVKISPRVQAAEAAEAEARHEALLELLGGTPLGVIYLIGPRRSPIGYIALSFGHSIARGGIIGSVEEFYLRRALRGRGIGTEVLGNLLRALSSHGLRALRVETEADAPGAGLFRRLGFREAAGQRVLTRAL
ncbi:acetyltransferase (GNAT) family protein [Brevirhabdus pacifica]|nr:GNAT family N-acetyltransferase [Brevirhabdus pacifica]PJJ87138.1 acetyltransferase (GNAT) family protein [Brevirhabdus pacifica]